MKNNILTERQICLCELIGEDHYLAKDFYLTGGTALTAFCLNHRSETNLSIPHPHDRRDVDSLRLG